MIKAEYGRECAGVSAAVSGAVRCRSILDLQFGEGALKSSTMLKKINAARHDEVPAQIKRWNRAGGKVLKGLGLPPRSGGGAVPYTVVLRDACPLSPSVAVSLDAH